MADIDVRPYSKDYEITDAMFGAFRAPGGFVFFLKVALWSAIPLAVIFYLAGGPLVRAYIYFLSVAASAGAAPPSATNAALGDSLTGLAWPLVVMSLGYMAVAALARAAFFRRYFHGVDDGVFPLRLGGDEWRQFLSLLGYYAVYLGVTLLVALAFGLVIGVLAGITSVAGTSTGAMVLMGVVGVVGYIGVYVLLVWILLRFVPASALTALRGRTHVLAARRVSKNRSWALLGSMLVAGLIAYFLIYFFFIIGAIVGLGPVAATFGSASGGDASAMVELFSALQGGQGFRIGGVVAAYLVAFGTTCYLLIIAGPPAFFTKQWANADPSDVF